MAWQLTRLTEAGHPPLVEAPALDRLLEHLIRVQRPRYRRLWVYYRNPITPRASLGADRGSDRPYRQGQEWGLPSRITGVQSALEIDTPALPVDQVARKEVVIENDIAWRIDTGVDYLFGRELRFDSTAPNPDRRALLTALLRQILQNHGGILFLQQLALLGSIHGFVDVLVKLNPDAPLASDDEPFDATLQRLAASIRFEIVEPSRALPIHPPTDLRQLRAYGQVYNLPAPRDTPPPPTTRRWLDRLRRAGTRFRTGPDSRHSIQVLELITPHRWQRYHDQVLVAEGINSLGEIPLVHIQNIPQPFEYAGASDVEPLMPLQDELNTRLCDRAHRITLQSFKMYLGKGIDNFLDQPVSPGRMWLASREDADVIEFGGDASCPSETAHIDEVREALDKTSSVTPIAAGAIKNRIGRLSSAAALRVTLLALLSKTDRKRTTYGAGLKRLCELSLAWLDRAGLLPTTLDERGIDLNWSSPLPENDLEKLDEAAAKLRVGVPQDQVLRELGYGGQ